MENNEKSFLALESVHGMYRSGSKILSHNTIQHTIFLDSTNEPFILLKKEKAQKVVQLFEKDDMIYIDVYVKCYEDMMTRKNYFVLTETYDLNIADKNISEIPALYVALSCVVTNALNKGKPKSNTNSNTVLTFNELVLLEKYFKKRGRVNISFGSNIMCLDSSRYNDFVSFEDAIISYFDSIAS